jgi:hypothetical protein
MGNRMDNQIGLLKESVFGTPVTPTRFYPYLDGTDGQLDTRQRQGQSIFVSSKRGWKGSRRVLPKPQGVITIKTELASRQGGALLELACGVSVSTLISGTSYLQTHKTSVTGTVLPSATIQLGKVRNDGTVDAETYAGCTAVSWEIECPEDGIITISVTFDALSMTTATGLATASYTAGAFLFDHSQGVATVGGSVTWPTTTALATGGTAFLNFRSWKLALDQNADIGRWVMTTAGRNQPTVGMLTPEFTADAEYNDTTLRTSYLAGTAVPVVITHTTPEVLSTGFSQFQLGIPQLFLKSPILPPMNDETAVVGISGDVTNDDTNELFYLAYRTADTTL